MSNSMKVEDQVSEMTAVAGFIITTVQQRRALTRAQGSIAQRLELFEFVNTDLLIG